MKLLYLTMLQYFERMNQMTNQKNMIHLKFNMKVIATEMKMML